jgi:hypothetical protein
MIGGHAGARAKSNPQISPPGPQNLDEIELSQVHLGDFGGIEGIDGVQARGVT